MPDIPDKVIEQAREAGTDGYARPDGPSRVREVAAEAAFAQVIAEWVRQQEQERIVAAKREAEQAMIEAPDDHAYTYWQGHVHALASLDREGEQ